MESFPDGQDVPSREIRTREKDLKHLCLDILEVIDKLTRTGSNIRRQRIKIKGEKYVYSIRPIEDDYTSKVMEERTEK